MPLSHSARFARRFVRLNNHEHTDIAEYMGTYVASPEGGIAFVEGALVTAVRQGHWIVLDELNLAPSDVLEALNRLLDDNRELFVPELQQTVRAIAAALRPHVAHVLVMSHGPPGAAAPQRRAAAARSRRRQPRARLRVRRRVRGCGADGACFGTSPRRLSAVRPQG
jgi:midasin